MNRRQRSYPHVCACPTMPFPRDWRVPHIEELATSDHSVGFMLKIDRIDLCKTGHCDATLDWLSRSSCDSDSGSDSSIGRMGERKMAERRRRGAGRRASIADRD